MTTKTGLMFQPHKKEVHYGRMNAQTGLCIGEPRNVTSDFLDMVPLMFPLNSIHGIENGDGTMAYHAATLDDDIAKLLEAAPALLKAAKVAIEATEAAFGNHPEYTAYMTQLQPLREAIAKAEAGEA